MEQNYFDFDFDFDDSYIKMFMSPSMLSNNRDGCLDMQTESKFTKPQEGFMKGNIQKGTYIPYKNMTYIKPIITNEKEAMLCKIQEIDFMAHDLNLYLDINPNDAEAIKLYNEYITESKKLTKEYERCYGPINLTSSKTLNMTPWAWIKEPWPWNM